MIAIVLGMFRLKRVVCIRGSFSSLGDDNLMSLCISSFVGGCVLFPLFVDSFGIGFTFIFIGAEAPDWFQSSASISI